MTNKATGGHPTLKTRALYCAAVLVLAWLNVLAVFVVLPWAANNGLFEMLMGSVALTTIAFIDVTTIPRLSKCFFNNKE